MTDDELRAEFQSIRDHVDARMDALTAEIDDRFAGVMRALDALQRALTAPPRRRTG